MASPKLTNGYLKIANELFDELCKIHLTGYENQALRAVIRLTYGYNQKSVKITLDKMLEMTQIKNRQRISEAESGLVSKNILKKSGRRFSINKNYKTWNKQKKTIRNFTENRKDIYGKPEKNLRKIVKITDEPKYNIKYKRQDKVKTDGFQPISLYADEFQSRVINK